MNWSQRGAAPDGLSPFPKKICGLRLSGRGEVVVGDDRTTAIKWPSFTSASFYTAKLVASN